jgi:hypothetical protein
MRYLAAALCAAVPLSGAFADEQAKARARAAVAVTLTMPQPEAKPAPAPADPNPWRWDDYKGWWRPVTSHSVTPGVQAAGWTRVSGVTTWGSPAALCPPGRG